MKKLEALRLIKKKSPSLIEVKALKNMYLDKTLKRLMAVDLEADRKSQRKRFGMKKDAYNMFCTKYGIKHGSWKKKIVLKKWNPEFTVIENAKIFGVTYSKALNWKYLYKLKSTKWRAARIQRLKNKKIIKFLLLNGFTLEAIGRMYGTSREYIRQLSK